MSMEFWKEVVFFFLLSFTNIPHCVCVWVCVRVGGYVCVLQRRIIVRLPAALQGESLHFQSVRSMLTQEEFDQKKWSSIEATLCWLSVLVTLVCASILIFLELAYTCLSVELMVYIVQRPLEPARKLFSSCSAYVWIQWHAGYSKYKYTPERSEIIVLG